MTGKQIENINHERAIVLTVNYWIPPLWQFAWLPTSITRRLQRTELIRTEEPASKATLPCWL